MDTGPTSTERLPAAVDPRGAAARAELHVPRPALRVPSARAGHVRVRTTTRTRARRRTHAGAALVLAGGTLGTARIVLASLGLYDRPVPLPLQPVRVRPDLNVGMLRRARASGATASRSCRDLRVGGTRSSRRSLLVPLAPHLQLMKETPLAYREALRILPSHPEVRDPRHPPRGPSRAGKHWRPPPRRARPLDMTYHPSDDEERAHAGRPCRPPPCFRRLGLTRSADDCPATARAVHYAGTFPIRPGREPHLRARRPPAPTAPSISPTARSSRGSRRRASLFNLSGTHDRVGRCSRGGCDDKRSW
jgi:hypothetical protein